MKKPNYMRKESKWRLYHKLETAEKKRIFRKMPENAGFRILKSLYSFACKVGVEKYPSKIDFAKIKTLSDVHSAFGNVIS